MIFLGDFCGISPVCDTGWRFCLVLDGNEGWEPAAEDERSASAKEEDLWAGVLLLQASDQEKDKDEEEDCGLADCEAIEDEGSSEP